MTSQTSREQSSGPSGAAVAAGAFGIVTLFVDLFFLLALLMPNPFAVWLLSFFVAIGNGWLALGILTGVSALPALIFAIAGHAKARSGGGMGRVGLAYSAAVVYFAIIGINLANGIIANRAAGSNDLPSNPVPAFSAPTEKPLPGKSPQASPPASAEDDTKPE